MRNLIRFLFTLAIITACNTLYNTDIAPVVAYKAIPESGKTTDTIQFDASLTQSGSVKNKAYYRWDWNRDGIWDEEFTSLPVTPHRYFATGTYFPRLEVINSGGLTDTFSLEIKVDQGYSAPRPSFIVTPEFGNLKTRFDVDKVAWCDIMGGLYNCYHATREDFYGEVRGICPMGWHMPSRKEWETLVTTVGGWDQADKLLPGGSSDFNALYAGFMEEVSDPKGGTKTVYKRLNYATYFWSFNKMSNPYAPNAWNIALLKDEKKFYPGFSSMESYFSVRCVKNEE